MQYEVCRIMNNVSVGNRKRRWEGEKQIEGWTYR